MSRSTQVNLLRLVIQGTVCRVRLDGKPFPPSCALLGTDEMICNLCSFFPCSFQRRSGRTDDRGRVGEYRMDTARVASDAVSHLGGTWHDNTQLMFSHRHLWAVITTQGMADSFEQRMLAVPHV